MSKIYLLAANLALLAGCAAPPPAAPMASAPQATQSAPVATKAAASGGLDGVYRSPPGGVSGNARCGTTMFGYPISVSNGVASMASVMNGTLEGPVGPDNALNIQKGRAILRGQFSDGQFNGTYSTGGCSFTLNYTKR